MPATMPASTPPPMLYGLPWGSPPAALKQALERIISERGWKTGTHLENMTALILSRFCAPRPEQQYRAGKYRLDFAWPSIKVAVEADGWWHRSPEGAARDRKRDSWLRSQGWIIFRVDDQYGEDGLAAQLVRVSRFVRSELRSL